MELIITIVIIAIVLTIILMTIALSGLRAITGERRTQAVQIAEGMMEQIKTKRFDENTSAPWTRSPLGIDEGEDPADQTTFDDIDDFNGWVEEPVAGFRPRYRLEAQVFYVTRDDLDAPPQDDPATPDVDESLEPTDYKHINVTVSNELLGSMTIQTMITGAS